MESSFWEWNRDFYANKQNLSEVIQNKFYNFEIN